MFNYLKGELKIESSSGRKRRPNLAQMCTLENRTPLVHAICHAQLTEEILRDLLAYMRQDGEEFSYPLLAPSYNLCETQILMGIALIARQNFKNYEHLQPIREVCNDKIFNQLFHFPCQYNNTGLLKWLIDDAIKFKEKQSDKKKCRLDLNVHDHAGYTPLLTAVFYGATECVQYLLQVMTPKENIFVDDKLWFLVRR